MQTPAESTVSDRCDLPRHQGNLHGYHAVWAREKDGPLANHEHWRYCCVIP